MDALHHTLEAAAAQRDELAADPRIAVDGDRYQAAQARVDAAYAAIVNTGEGK